MVRRRAALAAGAVLLSAALGVRAGGPGSQILEPDDAAARGVAYLSREVPRWRQEHACYSCHNNGDAARALIAAIGRKHDVRGAIDDTLAWLAEPGRWETNAGGEGGGDDKRLARIQFAFATLSAVDASLVTRTALSAAADLLSRDQLADGSWRLDSSGSVGSPATYGTALATAAARLTLAGSGSERFAAAIAKADEWLRAIEPNNVPDAVAVILGLSASRRDRDVARLRQAVDFLTRSHAPDGGWGPYANSPREPFDTAVAVIALRRAGDKKDAVARGRTFLIKAQLEDGSWLETTRPANQGSYAQRISTTAWALMAVLESGSDE